MKKVTRKPIKRKTAKKPVKKKPIRKKIVKKPKKVVKKPRKKVAPKKRITRKKPTKKKIVTKKRIPRKKPVKRKPVKRKPKKKITTRRTYSVGGPLEQLFESPVKVQVMKLFFRNPDMNFLLKEASKIMRLNLAMARKEIKRLEKIGILTAKKISPRRELFSINSNFDFFNELRELILKASPVSKDKMLKTIKSLGRVKLVLLTGIFVGNDTSRADLLIVGDSINQRRLNTFLKNLEAEAGTDIDCVAMNNEEFNYRYGMYDRFVRDLLNEKGEFLINRLNL